MQWIDRTRMASQVLAGTFLNLGSSAAVEIAAGTGFEEPRLLRSSEFAH
jgi:hypothetical protein